MQGALYPDRESDRWRYLCIFMRCGPSRPGGPGREIVPVRFFKAGGLRQGQASAPMLRGAYLKYLRSGGFWPFFVGMRRPSALTM
jgi:hypothetical protein